MHPLYWIFVGFAAYLTVGVVFAYFLAKADSDWTAMISMSGERESPCPGTCFFVVCMWPFVPVEWVLGRVWGQFKRDVKARRASKGES